MGIMCSKKWVECRLIPSACVLGIDNHRFGDKCILYTS